MIPLKLLSALTKANDFLKNNKGGLLSASEELDDSEAPDLSASKEIAPERSTPGGVNITERSKSAAPPPKPLKGAGTETFKELAPQALQFWLETLRAMRPQESGPHGSNVTIALPAGAQVSNISVDTDGDEDIEVSEQANAAVVAQQEEEDGQWDFLWFVLLGIISYYGVKLVSKGGKWLITTSAAGIRKLLNEFSNADSTTIMNLESLNAQAPDGGIGRILLGSGYKITTRYKAVDSLHPKGHSGIDYGAALGTPVHTALTGVVTFTKWGSETAGNYVEVASPNGFVQRFLHLDSINVSVGQRVGIGDQIGTVGNTGRSTGAHLHYEVYKGVPEVEVGKSVFMDDRYTRVDPAELASYLRVNAAEAGVIKASDRPDYMLAQALPGGVNMELPKYLSPTAKGYNYMSVTTTGTNPWRGETGSTKNSAVTLATFSSPEFGWRAGMMNVLNYQTKHDVSGSGGRYVTIADIASNDKNHSYVSSKNGDNVEQWAANVAKGSGFKTTDRIDLRDPDTLARVAQGIGMAEHSVKTDAAYLRSIIRTYNITSGPASNKQ